MGSQSPRSFSSKGLPWKESFLKGKEVGIRQGSEELMYNTNTEPTAIYISQFQNTQAPKPCDQNDKE